MRGVKQFLSSLIAIILFIPAFAQNSGSDVAMADTMRSNGRIYVVVAVMVTILVGLILYLVRLDRKISKLEKAENKSL